MIYTPVKVFDISYFHAIYRSGALPVFDTEFLTREDILEKAFNAGGASARQAKEKQQRHGCGHPSPNCFLSKHRPVPVLLEPGGTNLKRKAPARLTRAGFGKFT